MADQTKAKKLADEIYVRFKNRCVFMRDVIKYIGNSSIKRSASTAKVALMLLEADKKVRKYKLVGGLVLYCFGKHAALEYAVNYKKIENCIKTYAPSFRLKQIVDCLGISVAPSEILPLYTAVVYTLMKMVNKGQIHSFTVLNDGRKRYKVIIRA